MPGAKDAPFNNPPCLLPTLSLALASAGHQLTKPAGGGVQVVRSAEAVRTMVAEIIVLSKTPGFRTRLCNVIRGFILNFSQGGLQATNIICRLCRTRTACQ